MIEIHLPNELDDNETYSIKAIIRDKHKEEIVVNPGKVVLGMDLAIVSSISIFIIATINLCYTIYKDNKNNNSWNKDRIIEVLENELLKTGITDYSDLNISNYLGLIDNTYSPCIVSIKIKGDKIIKYKIYRDGQVFRFSNE